MAILALIKSAASSLWRRLASLARALAETEEFEPDAPRRDWEEHVFQRREF